MLTLTLTKQGLHALHALGDELLWPSFYTLNNIELMYLSSHTALSPQLFPFYKKWNITINHSGI